MKNSFLGLRTVIYKVSDLQKAKEWYAKAFAAEPYFDEPFYVGFNIGGYELGLQPDDNQDSHKQDNVLTYWGVNDVESAYGKLLKNGAQAHEAPTEVGGGIIVASLKDPWQNIIGIIYNPHFSLAEK